MTRAQQTVSIALLVTAGVHKQLYLSVYTQILPLPLPAKVQTEILPVLPLWGLVSFGAYLLASLGWSLITFNDVPEAYTKLTKEIEVARGELKSMGVEVD